ncbi:MAG: exonuclease SbcCD subunit D [Elusimicrobiota bacterium]|nr:exonuclease SbcCD subunit D [Elusimicrobiota bacterium]
MKFIHTSDWHLGKLLFENRLIDDQAHALAQLLELAKAEKPDAIFISGDIYDRAVPPPEAVQLCDETLSTLVLTLKIPVILIAGNHDSPERLDFGSRVFESNNLFIRGDLKADISPVELQDKHGKVLVYPLPYAGTELFRDRLKDASLKDQNAGLAALVARLKAAHPKNTRSVALAHVFLTGGATSESERPLSIGGSEAVDKSIFSGFSYTALGHLHGPQKQADNIVYSGSLYKYSFSEKDHKKRFILGEIDAKGACALKDIPITLRRELRVVEGKLDEIIKAGRGDKRSDDYILARVLDDGPVFDAMGRLREVYPNTLHIERPLFAPSAGVAMTREQCGKGPLELFTSFYKQVTPAELSKEQAAAFKEGVAVAEKAQGEEE